ncbi:MAG: histidinol dehydrogenase [Gemmatimonadaceae bacterium]|nr:histidinol dehydrogenase [Gemmatimonadaceae bacterium]
MTPPRFRFSGPVSALSSADRRALFDRSTSADQGIRTGTATIIAQVQREGDDALRALAARFDGATLSALEVPRAEWDRARDAMQPALRAAIERTVRNVRAAHRAFLPTAVEVETEPGVVIGRRPDPLRRVGVYAPGGRAAYPSSLVMGVVPAKVAGVRDVIVCSPPSATGLPTDVVLAAAAIAGADRLFAVGGAGAVAAMAYGTATVPRVDRIVGPGNAWVAEAKLQCAGAVAIDSPAGPSELLVIADESSDMDAVALEMLAQAEHDPRAAVVCVTIGEGATAALLAALDARCPVAGRDGIVQEAFAQAGGVLQAGTLEDAITFANEWAAEHLLLAVHAASRDAAFAALRGAGAVFIGESASVAFGDYMTGANHVLPTGGLSRCYSGLSTLDFIRWTSWQRVTPDAAAALADDVARFADSEGLPNHAAAARQWSPTP